jgi:uncharacterized protein YdhG (YjbR/CyaY superfamily)
MAAVPSVDDYIASFPEDVRIVLEQVRRTIRGVVPAAEETISYQMPTYKVDGRRLVYFAGWKQHVSVYPIPGDEAFKREIAPYQSGKGTLKFPLSRPVPYDLVERLVAFLLAERG